MHRRAGTKDRRREASGRSLWVRTALLAALAFAVIGGREGFFPIPSLDRLGGLAGRPPIRAAMNVHSERADCRVTRIVDGDTVDVACPAEGVIRARLLGFDTPEVFSPKCPSELALGHRASSALKAKVRAAGQVRVVFAGLDKYHRRLTRLYLDGADVADTMVAEGLARPYDGGHRAGWCG